jgi:H+/Cl- antiporter ClcA
VADKQARAYVRTLLFSAVLGIPVAFAAVLYETALHYVTDVVWDEIPDALGWNELAWWYVILVPGLAGLLVAAALRLPGHGGHGPLEGLGVDPIRPVDLGGILLATLATLGLGLVLGPEAPLIALGLGLGTIAVRIVGVDETNARLLALAGAFAAISTLFGNPLITAFLLFELVAAAGTVPAQAMGRALLPGFIAAGTGALVFTGVEGWPGLHQTELALSSVPSYGTVRVADVIGCLLLGAVVAAVVVAFRHLAHGIAVQRSLGPTGLLVVAGVLVGVLAVVFRAITDRPVELVLFSGQAGVPAVIAEGSAGVLLLLVVAKGLAWALSLGGGFRGGPVFPALAIGTALAVAAADVGVGIETTPAAATGIAAAWAATLRTPFSAVLIALVLVGPAAAQVAPIAVLAAAVGWLVATALPNPEDRSAATLAEASPTAERRTEAV